MHQTRFSRNLLISGLFTLLYFAAGKLGLRLAFVNASASAVWPATGIAMGGLLVLGLRAWPCVLLGAFLVNITTAGTVATSLGIAAGNMLEAVCGAWLVNRWAGGRQAFDRAQDALKFAVLAAITATMVSATFGVTSLALGGFAAWKDFGSIWRTWWLGDVGGALVAAPLVLTWANRPRLDWDRRHSLEVGISLLALAAAGGAVFGGWFPPAQKGYPFLFLLVPTLVWVGFRFAQRETATAMAAVSAMAVAGTLHGLGPFSLETPHESLLFLQGFLAMVAVMSMTLSAAVAERKQAERAVAQSDALYRTMAETASDAFMTIDETNTILFVNHAAEQTFGYDAAEMVGHKLTMLMSEEMQAAYVAGLERYLRTGRKGIPWRSVELSGRHKSGRVFPVEISIGESVQGGRRIFTGIARDVTERKRAAAELERQKLAAEAANQAKDVFLAMLSHELRAPLTPVISTLDELDSRLKESAEGNAAMAMIRRNIEHEARLIDDLLDLTRIVKGKLDLRRGRVDAHRCLLEAAELCRAEMAQKRIELRTDLGASQHFVNADPTKLQQIIWNLLRNAVKFSAEGSVISLASENSAAGALAIRVSDQGIGIEAEALGRIFTAFEQGDRSIHRRFGGLGLGLAISRALAAAHGGSLTAASDGPGAGATFTLTLEALPPEASVAGMEATEPPVQKPTADLRILLVDDHEDTQQALQRLLRLKGYQVECAADVRSALELAARWPFDLLVSDIGLPDESGFELIRRLRLERPIKGIALSGFGMEGDLEKSRTAGFMEHLLKPVKIQDLEAAIRNALAQP